MLVDQGGMRDSSRVSQWESEIWVVGWMSEYRVPYMVLGMGMHARVRQYWGSQF